VVLWHTTNEDFFSSEEKDLFLEDHNRSEPEIAQIDTARTMNQALWLSCSYWEYYGSID
jgi:hypothetical protein